LPEKSGTGDEKEIVKRWEDAEQLKIQRLARMRTVDGLVQKIIPRMTNEKTVFVEKAEGFHRLSDQAEKELVLVSYTTYSPGIVLGIAYDSKALSEKVLPAILDKLPARRERHFRIADEAGTTMAGMDIGQMEEPRPRLALSKRFADEFPPWTIEIYQSGTDTAAREFRLKRNIYILTVAVVMMAVLFGGVLAIRSTAKELRLAKLKSEFVATVSHEFRTPLTSIRYMAELLQRGRVQGEEKKEHYYETISQESDRLSRLVENILDFSKIEAGVKEYQFEETDIGELARDAASRFSEQITEKEFSIRSEISGQIPLIPADREAISRALFNVLDNAVKYSGNSREAFLRAWSDRENIYLELRDQGIGIGKDEQKRVFEKFFRSEHIHDSSIRGSGIGLTLV
jgi:signal transduction histidine kinase